ncbi:DUF2142 domain-containing protein [Enterococcus sp. LJL120]
MSLQNVKPEKIFLVLGTIFVGFMIFFMPINRTPDEANHARMTWGIVYEDTEESLKWMDLTSADEHFSGAEYKELFTEKLDLSNENFKLSFSLKSLNHLPQLIGMLIGSWVYPSIGVMFTLGRLFNALFYLIALYFLIKATKFGKKLLAFVSLLPMMIQQTASLSYDVENYVAIAAFYVLLTNLLFEKVVTRKYLILILLSTITLYITKTNNLLLVPLLVLLPLHFPVKYQKLNQFVDKSKNFVWRYKYPLSAIVIIGGLIGAQILLASQGGLPKLAIVLFNTVFNNNLNGHLNGILTAGIFGFFGNFTIELPMWLIFIDVVAVFILAYDQIQKNEMEIPKVFGLFTGLMIPLQILAIITGMYYQWTYIDLGENAWISTGAQGRYFTPFLLFVAPFLQSLHAKLEVKIKDKTSMVFMSTVLIFNFLTMVYLIAYVYWRQIL